MVKKNPVGQSQVLQQQLVEINERNGKLLCFLRTCGMNSQLFMKVNMVDDLLRRKQTSENDICWVKFSLSDTENTTRHFFRSRILSSYVCCNLCPPTSILWNQKLMQCSSGRFVRFHSPCPSACHSPLPISMCSGCPLERTQNSPEALG